LNPLSPGKHTPHFAGTASFTAEATYDLTVVPAGQIKRADGDHSRQKSRNKDHRGQGKHRS
jgi:hypothetical protein